MSIRIEIIGYSRGERKNKDGSGKAHGAGDSGDARVRIPRSGEPCMIGILSFIFLEVL